MSRTDQEELSFESFDVSTSSVYIVEGSSGFGVYHILRAVNPATKRNHLLFILQGVLQVDLSNWEVWRKCDKALYQIEDNDDEVLRVKFDVDPRSAAQTHIAGYPTNKDDVDRMVDQNVDMFIINEADFKINESEFPMKLKRAKVKGKELKNIIDINCSHLFKKKTAVIKSKFLSSTNEPFVTKIEVLEADRKGKNIKRKHQDEKTEDAKRMKESPGVSDDFQEIKIAEKSFQENKGDNLSKDLEEKVEISPSNNWSEKLKENYEASTAEDKPLTLTQQNILVLGLKLPAKDITTEDTKLPPWTDLSRRLYREKKTLFDNKYASKWMRWWFEEHQDMPQPPDNPKRSAWAIYVYEKQTELNCFNNKKMQKKIGQMWKELPENKKASYMQKNVEQKDKFNKMSEEYEIELMEWREKKKAKPKRSDGKPDCNCQYCLGEESG